MGYPNRKIWASRPEGPSAFQPRNSASLHADHLAEMEPTPGIDSEWTFTRELSTSIAPHPSLRRSPSSGSTPVLMSISLSGSSEQVRGSEKRELDALAFQAFVD